MDARGAEEAVRRVGESLKVGSSPSPLVGLLGGVADGAGGGFWMPRAASTAAPKVDSLFDFILWVCIFFFALIVGLLILFIVKYRRRDGREPEPSPDHNTSLELTWTLIPLVLVLVMFAWGFKVFLDDSTPPADAYEVQVTARKWKWLFTYPNGFVDENLHVPLDRPVKVVMTSEDVIHSFYVPAFRIKRDVVPGRYSTLWFKATRAGTFQVFCAEYCGDGHSNMLASVIVHEPGEFGTWLRNAAARTATLPPAEVGEHLYRTRGCAQCHSVDGSAGVGPSFRGVFGSTVHLRGGGTVLADENYIRESVLDPQAKVVAGFDPVMPTYKGSLSDQDISAIVAYLKSLKK